MNKGLPNNIDAEKSLIGSMFWSKASLQKGCEDVEPDFFYLERNAIIFATIKTLYNRHDPVDVNTVTTELVDRNLLNQVGGVEYLSEIINSVATGANIEYYINSVAEKYTLRRPRNFTEAVSALMIILLNKSFVKIFYEYFIKFPRERV